MLAHLLQYWDRVRASFWFLPAVLVAASIALAWGTVVADRSLPDGWLESKSWAFTRSAEGASMILGTIAGSMITIAGVVFSLTLVALTLASSQFGPRLLRNFMRDTVNQMVIGTFVSTFLYCLLILRVVRREEAGDYVPHLSVSIGVLLAMVSMAVLIYFIHHVAVSIQADEIVTRVHTELMKGVDRLFPEHLGGGEDVSGNGPGQTRLPPGFDREARTITSPGDGYLQIIDPGGLMELAVDRDLRLRVERRPGHYVSRGVPLVRAWPPDRGGDDLEDRLRALFILDNRRSPAQDVEFSIDQLVEIAVRALSPGVNDPFTAMSCVDRLGSALSRLARRRMPSPFRRDDRGDLRIVAPAVTFPNLVDEAFHQIRQAARGNAAVTIRIMETIAEVAAVASREEDCAALGRHAEMIARGARDGLPEIEDRRAVDERYRAVVNRLRVPVRALRP